MSAPSRAAWTIEHRARIDAPPELVWSVTIDVDRWPEWTPTVTSVVREDSGPLRVGSAVTMKQPGQPAARWVVTELVDGQRFAWETRRRGLRMVGAHDLTPDGAATINTLRLEASGWLARMLGPLLRRAVRRALAAESDGLVTVCEARARESGAHGTARPG